MSEDEINRKIAALEAERQALQDQARQAQYDKIKAKWAGDGLIQPKQATYWELDYNDLDRLFAQQFGIETEAVAEQEWNNYSCYTFNTRQDWYDDYDRARVQKWLATNGKEWPDVSNLLCELVARGAIPEGEYLINVFW